MVTLEFEDTPARYGRGVRLYAKDDDSLYALTSSGVEFKIADSGSASGLPSGPVFSIQYNNGGSFGGFGSWDGTTATINAISTTDLVSSGNVRATQFLTTDAFSSTSPYGALFETDTYASLYVYYNSNDAKYATTSATSSSSSFNAVFGDRVGRINSNGTISFLDLTDGTNTVAIDNNGGFASTDNFIFSRNGVTKLTLGDNYADFANVAGGVRANQFTSPTAFATEPYFALAGTTLYLNGSSSNTVQMNSSSVGSTNYLRMNTNSFEVDLQTSNVQSFFELARDVASVPVDQVWLNVGTDSADIYSKSNTYQSRLYATQSGGYAELSLTDGTNTVSMKEDGTLTSTLGISLNTDIRSRASRVIGELATGSLTGAGLEMSYIDVGGGTFASYLKSYDRTGATAKPLVFDASSHTFIGGDVDIQAGLTANSLTVDSGGVSVAQDVHSRGMRVNGAFVATGLVDGGMEFSYDTSGTPYSRVISIDRGTGLRTTHRTDALNFDVYTGAGTLSWRFGQNGELISSKTQTSASAPNNALYRDIDYSNELAYKDNSGNRNILTPAFAGIYVDDGVTAQSIASGATFTKSTAFTTNQVNRNATSDQANDKITITQKGVYKIEYNASYSSGTPSVIFEASAFIGGTEAVQVHSDRKMNSSGDVGSASGQGLVEITSVPVDVDLRFAHNNGSAVNLTVASGSLTATRIG